MPEQRRLIVIAKQREFDEEKWKELLMAMAYYLHEQRRVQIAEQGDNKTDAQTIP